MIRKTLILLAFVSISACGANEEKPVKVTQCNSVESETITIGGSSFQMGSDAAYAEERPSRSVDVTAFNIDNTEVTNARFAAFIADTGYVTDAEKLQPGFDGIGSAVFVEPSATNPNWWQFVEGANWLHPDGPNSNIEGMDNYPVVQVSLNDALAFANWADRRLPTEAEWEFAAAGDGGAEKGNTWQGAFPVRNTLEDGYLLRSPAGCFEPNDNGLYDMIGNVWEWTDTTYQDSAGEPIHVIKGGSFLCAPSYCRRYRASARQPQEAGLPTNHIGFRTVSNVSE